MVSSIFLNWNNNKLLATIFLQAIITNDNNFNMASSIPI